MSVRKLLGFGLLLLLFLQGTAVAENLRDTVENGKVSLDVRYRFEFVDQDGVDRSAKASTLRLRLGGGKTSKLTMPLNL